MTLRVSSTPSGKGAHDEKVRPVEDEQNLRYIDWVEGRRAYVEKASNGRIGYIHLPNTAVEGNRELFKGFYPQATEGRADPRRPLQRRRLHPRPDDRAARPASPQLLGAPRPRAGVHARVRQRRPEGLPDQRPGRFGRRRLPVLLQEARHGAADRHHHLGWPDRPLRQSEPRRHRVDLGAELPLPRPRRGSGRSRARGWRPTSASSTARKRSPRGATRCSKRRSRCCCRSSRQNPPQKLVVPPAPDPGRQPLADGRERPALPPNP